MTEFEKCAREYCEARLMYLDLKKQIRAKAAECDSLEEVNEPEHEYNPVIIGTPCWLETDGYGDQLSVEDRCEACQENQVLVEKRRAIGRKLAGLAMAMYRAFQQEVRP